MSAQAIAFLKETDPVAFRLADQSWLEHVANVMQAYAEHLEAEKWVSVDDGLPEIGQKVFIDREEITPSVYDGRFQVYKDICVGDRVLASYFTDVKKWRPFPQPPKSQEKEQTTTI